MAEYASVEDMLDDLLVVNWIAPPRSSPEERTPKNYRIKLEQWVMSEIQTWNYFEAEKERWKNLRTETGSEVGKV